MVFIIIFGGLLIEIYRIAIDTLIYNPLSLAIRQKAGQLSWREGPAFSIMI